MGEIQNQGQIEKKKVDSKNQELKKKHHKVKLGMNNETKGKTKDKNKN